MAHAIPSTQALGTDIRHIHHWVAHRTDADGHSHLFLPQVQDRSCTVHSCRYRQDDCTAGIDRALSEVPIPVQLVVREPAMGYHHVRGGDLHLRPAHPHPPQHTFGACDHRFSPPPCSSASTFLPLSSVFTSR